MSFSMEKDEIFRDEELRKHPFWISGDSNGWSDRGRMVDNMECDGSDLEGSKVNREEEKKKTGTDWGLRHFLSGDLVWLCGRVHSDWATSQSAITPARGLVEPGSHGV